MIGIATLFNEYVEELYTPPKTFKQPKTDGKTPFDDYDDRGDVVGLLQSHGWNVVARKGSKTLLLRPSATTSKTSGNWDEKL